MVDCPFKGLNANITLDINEEILYILVYFVYKTVSLYQSILRETG